MPDFSIELSIGGMIAGVDEAGRGPWAGPVVAAAVILNPQNIPSGIADSKKLTAAKREAIFEQLQHCATIGVGQASVEEIDQLNILKATFLAMRRAVENLPSAPTHILVDGNQLPPLPYPAQTVIRGDDISLSIAAASIIAKVTRDRHMHDLAQQFPAYGWERNAGYGTAPHIKALELHGITPHHRKSFKPIAKLIAA